MTLALEPNRPWDMAAASEVGDVVHTPFSGKRHDYVGNESWTLLLVSTLWCLSKSEQTYYAGGS
jgi:hypothetical protein